MFGGNPASHPQFDVLCEILRKHIPFEQRGLWCNNLLGKGAIARKTFNPKYSNLNVHQDEKAYNEFRTTWPEAQPFGLKNQSRHSPVYVAMQDVLKKPDGSFDEEKAWELTGNCDVNQQWSAMIGVFRGELRGWFCEIAGAQAMLHQYESDYPDTGMKVFPGWWNQPMSAFESQARFHCMGCGFPLKGYGALDNDENGTEQVSETHAGVYKTKRPNRNVQIVTTIEQVKAGSLKRGTEYIENARI